MEKINSIEIEKKSHFLKITIYPNIVSVMVAMPMDQYVEYIKHGIETERKALQNLMTSVFKQDFEGKKIFYSEDEINQYFIQKRVKLEVGGHFSKNVIFEIDTDNFEESIDKILSYIKTQSENYEKQKSPNKEGIINKLFGKYFSTK